jgi:putative ABC transport system permease protein
MREWLESLAQDSRYALRGLRRSPGFTLVAVLTVAVGVSASTTIFSAMNAILLRRLPYPSADRLVNISLKPLKHPQYLGPVSDGDVARWRAENNSFEQIEITSRPDMVALSGAGTPERVGVQHVSPGLFPLLGVNAALGTLPSEKEVSREGFNGVALSYEFWQRHFAGDPKVLGRSVFVDNDLATVVAVLNPGFDLFGAGPAEAFEFDGISAASESESEEFDPRWLLGVGKLRPGVSLQQAQASMDVIAQHLAQAYPRLYRDLGVKLEPLQEGLFGWSSRFLYPLFGAVIFVLLIACANVANLLLFRADVRRKEIGIRVALGASRKRLARQLLTESILLALMGGGLGLAFSLCGVRLFDALSPHDLPRTARVAVDGQVLLFTLAICIFTGLLFGLAPVFGISRIGVNDFLKQGRGSAPRPRMKTRSILVVVEVALALVLLAGAGLMIKALERVLHTNPGFNPDHVLTAQIRLTGRNYIDVSNWDKSGLNVIKPQVGLFCRQVLERIKALPGIESAALIDWLPLSEDSQRGRPGFVTAGQQGALPGQRPHVLLSSISSDFFQVMKIPVLKGRGIAERDTDGAPWVAVINEAMARKFWPNQDAIGQVITMDSTPGERPREIVGIVGNIKQRALTAATEPEVYVSYAQQDTHSTAELAEGRVHKTLVVRTSYVSKGLIESVRGTLSELAADSPVFGITLVQRTVSDSARPWTFLAELLGIFAAVALLLAAVGIYGVISYSVSERRQEIGIRMALGARSGRVFGLVLKQTLTLSILGVALGLAASFGATPVLSRFLFGVKPHDLLTLGLVSALLIFVTLLASYVPAKRAMRIDPMLAIRHE